jgi:uncharacterized protein (TIGR00266 family)
MSERSITTELKGSNAFRLIEVTIPPMGMVIVESGAMASLSSNLRIETFFNGGFLASLAMRFLGGESLFINWILNPSKEPGKVHLSQGSPGDIIERRLNNETLYVQPGAFIAREKSVKASVVWAGFASWLGGEGLFRLRFSGVGRIWYGVYGAILEKEVVGEYIVDSGHLLSYPSHMKLSVRLAGSLFSSLLSKEGFVLKLQGHGKIQLQTRSIKGLAQWLNPRFWG